MTIRYLIPVFIYFIMPILGLVTYLKLALKMHSQIDDPPYFSLFLLFNLYGGIVVILFTTLFWKWSGIASLFSFFLLLIGPLITCIIAIYNNEKKYKSIYHKWIFYSAAFYTSMFVVLLMFSFIIFIILLI